MTAIAEKPSYALHLDYCFFSIQSSNHRCAVSLPPEHISVMTDCATISLLHSLQCLVVVRDTWFMRLIVLISKYAHVSHFRSEVRGR